jgi:hypothetical protein
VDYSTTQRKVAGLIAVEVRVAAAAMTGFRFILAESTASRAPTIRRETIMNLLVQSLTVILLDLSEFQQKLALRFRKNFQCSAQIPNDDAVLLSSGLVILHQFRQQG